MPTMLITGANRGLGLNLLKLYNDEGWQIHACCRNPDAATELQSIADQAKDRVTVHRLDVEDPSTIADLKAALGPSPIDLLINMAGYLGKTISESGGLQSFGESDFSEWKKAYRTNCIGPMRVCEALVDNVEASDKKTIINISSIIGSIAGDTFGNLYGYRASKAALNSITHAMAINLKDRGITVVPFHPGFVKTDMGGPDADIEIAESVTGIKSVVDKITHEDTGRFLTWEGGELPW